ncbi:LSU ribosomal protein L24P [Giardia duodenalis]|uniref:LSU ribosomal protein L24P n=1 Tax=Giardia intestinalis TaxID=5741 RepID=V6U1R8_GIAIN|nr:LSU ribosomal protein L24P [Giardia intestinalis]
MRQQRLAKKLFDLKLKSLCFLNRFANPGMKLNSAVTASRRKCRKAYFTANAETRAKMMSSRLSKELRAEHKIKTMPIRRGDIVEIFTGGHKGTGKVVEVRRRDYKICVEGINQKARNPEAKPVPYPIHPSNCIIKELYMNGSRHRAIKRRQERNAERLARIGK